MKRFPAFLNLVDRRVVIVGGGEAAAQKARLFAAAGADLLIVAEDLAESLRSEFDARAGLLERAPKPDQGGQHLRGLQAGVLPRLGNAVDVAHRVGTTCPGKEMYGLAAAIRPT